MNDGERVVDPIEDIAVHQYVSDMKDVTYSRYLAAILSLSFHGILISILKNFAMNPEYYMYLPSAFIIYGSLIWIYDNYIWRWNCLQDWQLVGTRVIEGVWEGTISSLHSEGEHKHPVCLHVEQTRTTISLKLDGEKSVSFSRMASFYRKTSTNYELVWEYETRSKTSDPDDAFNHSGITRLLIVSNGEQSCAIGTYYTEQKRDTYGSIKLRSEKRGK